MQPYLELGYRVVFTSAIRRIGIKELRRVLEGKMTVIAGLSGVGKSSLLTAVQPSLRLRTAEISSRLHGGRHTTTQVNLHRLEVGGYIADTPGIREFGLGNLQRGELLQFYPELAAISQKCRFANCSHIHEPGCAVQVAVDRGEIAAMRYQSYCKIYQDLPE
jgi:ribosome biogenesis GTPase